MRRESLFFGVLTLVASAFLTGCSDDDTEVYVPQRVAEFNLSDESDGNRLFIIHPWAVSYTHLTLPTNSRV